MASQRERQAKKDAEVPPKKGKKDPQAGDGDGDDDKEDLEQVLEEGKRKRMMQSLYKQLVTTGEYATTSQDRKTRMLA